MILASITLKPVSCFTLDNSVMMVGQFSFFQSSQSLLTASTRGMCHGKKTVLCTNVDDNSWSAIRVYFKYTFHLLRVKYWGFYPGLEKSLIAGNDWLEGHMQNTGNIGDNIQCWVSHRWWWTKFISSPACDNCGLCFLKCTLIHPPLSSR